MEMLIIIGGGLLCLFLISKLAKIVMLSAIIIAALLFLQPKINGQKFSIESIEFESIAPKSIDLESIISKSINVESIQNAFEKAYSKFIYILENEREYN